jgi:hypothetical protein
LTSPQKGIRIFFAVTQYFNTNLYKFGALAPLFGHHTSTKNKKERENKENIIKLLNKF